MASHCGATELENVGEGADAGAVDQDVDRAELLDARVDHEPSARRAPVMSVCMNA